MLHLFSAREELLRYGRDHYRPHARETSTLLYELFKVLGRSPSCPTNCKNLSVKASTNCSRVSLRREERLKGLPAEEVVKALPPETLGALARRLKANGSDPQSP
jgi:hypothetical protein